MKSILITGGTGTISASLVKEYILNGYKVTALNRGTKRWRELDGCDYVHLDMNDADGVKAFLKNRRFDIVIDCLVFNLTELKRSLEYFAERCERYIFVSTTAIYKRKQNEFITEDNWEELTDWDYAADKIECEKFLVTYCEAHGLDYTIVRPPVVYGDYRVPFPVISRKSWYEIYQRMIEGRPLVNNNLEKVRYCILHSSDFARAVRLLLESNKSNRECFHVTDEKALYDWDDVISIAAEILECDRKIVHVAHPVFEETFPALYPELLWNKNEDLLLNGEKLFNLTGFEAKKTIKEGMKENIASIRNEFMKYNHIRDYDYEYACDKTILIGIERGLIKDSDVPEAWEYRSYINGCGKV